MEQSALRIAGFLALLPDTKVVVYARDGLSDGQELAAYRKAGISFVDLKPEMDSILAPAAADPGRRDIELFRAIALALGCAVQRSMGTHPADRHALMSFSVSSNGFIAQHVAFELRIPHVACIRGTDLNRDRFRGDRIAAIDFTVRNADWIVTANRQQERILEAAWGRTRNVATVCNSSAPGPGGFWQPHRRDRIHFFSDTGYSLKKGSHRLAQAIGELAGEGWPVALKLVGRPAKPEAAFWHQFIMKHHSAEGALQLGGHLPAEEVLLELGRADIYCSASLAEGCSLGTLNALVAGIPIVATRCGALPEMAEGLEHVFLSHPADSNELKENLKRAVTWLREGGRPDAGKISGLRAKFCAPAEAAQWQAVLDSAWPAAAGDPAEPPGRPSREART